MEELKQIALAFGAPAALINAALKEEKEEGFDLKAQIAEAVTEAEEVRLIKLKPAIEAEYEEREKENRYKATVTPIINKYRKLAESLGATSADLEGKDAKQLAGIIEKRIEVKTTEVQTQTDEGLRTELNEYKNKFATTARELEELRNAIPQKEKELKDRYAQRDQERTVERLLASKLRGEAFADVKNVADLPEVMAFYIQKEGYTLKPTEDGKNLDVFSKDGSIALSLDKSRKVTDADSFLVDLARHKKLFPDHNGGGGDELPKLGERTVGGKKVNYAGANFLAESMGETIN